jgi:ribosomal RNA assembly protein
MQTRVSIIIPQDRVGVVIGAEGAVKESIERAFAVELHIDGESGLVEVVPRPENADASSLLKARDAVSAIARGFAPEKALELQDDDIVFDMFDLRQIFGKSDSDIQRIKGRVIGREGKIRRLIEEMTDAKVSVYGHTIGMIGEFEEVAAAREAIQMILDGKQHLSLYKFLRKVKSEAKRRKTLELWRKGP